MINLFNYIDRPSAIHRLTGATKLVCMLCWCLAAMTSFYTPLLAAMTLAGVLLFRLSKITFRDVWFLLAATLAFMVLNNVMIYLFSPEHGTTIYGSRTVLLEFNHDAEMVKNGPYPYPLKARILSDQGHLSNKFAAKVAARLCQTGTKTLLLAHLSAENNTPQLALTAAREALEGMHADIRLAPRCELGEPVLL